MALTPANPPAPNDRRQQREAAQDDVLAREVDDAVRQDEVSELFARYGKPLLAVVVIGLAAFAAYLYWDGQSEGQLEQQSETMISALDQLEAGNLDTANETLTGVADNAEEGPRATALLLQAGIAQEQGNLDQAAKIFASVAADESAPQTMRDLATIREIAATYDTRDPAEIISRLKPLAQPGNPWFGSAGEMVAMAYIKQGKRGEAGAMLAEVSKDDDVPDSLRSRARQLAGLLGVDAIEDVDEVLEEIADASQDGQPAPAQ